MKQILQYKYKIYIFLVFFLWSIAQSLEFNDMMIQECRKQGLTYNSDKGECNGQAEKGN